MQPLGLSALLPCSYPGGEGSRSFFQLETRANQPWKVCIPEGLGMRNALAAGGAATVSNLLRDGFDLLEVVEIVARHGFDEQPEGHWTTLGVGHELGHDGGRDHRQ